MRAELFRHDEFVAINLYPDERRLRVEDDPFLPGYDPDWRIWFYWDDDKLDRGEHEFLGVEVPNIDRLEEQGFLALERLNPPSDRYSQGASLRYHSRGRPALGEAITRESAVPYTRVNSRQVIERDDDRRLCADGVLVRAEEEPHVVGKQTLDIWVSKFHTVAIDWG